MKIYGVGINGSGVSVKGKGEAVKSMEGGISKLPQLKIGKKKSVGGKIGNLPRIY